jgi:hypothetical protein
MLKAIHAQEDRPAAAAKGKEVVARLRAMKLKSAADLVKNLLRYPRRHAAKISYII